MAKPTRLILDIRTAIVSKDQTIWAMHAGGSRKFAPQFYSEKAIFLDIPGANLNARVLGDIQALRRTVRMADAVVKYHRERRNQKQPQRPSRLLSDYSGSAGRKENAGLNARVGNVLSVFRDMKKGDIVFVPITMNGTSFAIAGEIASDFSPTDTTSYDYYQRDQIPYRRVRWLSDPIPRRIIDGELSKRLSNRHAVIRITEDLRRIAISQIYRNVIVDGASETKILGQRYDGKQVRTLVNAIRFLEDNIALTGFVGIDSKVSRPADDLSEIDYSKILDDFALEFNSPGVFKIAMKATRAAVIVGLILCLESDVPQQDLVAHLSVTNSLAPSDRTVSPLVLDQIRDLVDGLPDHKFKAMRKDAQKIRNEIGLNTDGELRK